MALISENNPPVVIINETIIVGGKSSFNNEDFKIKTQKVIVAKKNGETIDHITEYSLGKPYKENFIGFYKHDRSLFPGEVEHGYWKYVTDSEKNVLSGYNLMPGNYTLRLKLNRHEVQEKQISLK